MHSFLTYLCFTPSGERKLFQNSSARHTPSIGMKTVKLLYEVSQPHHRWNDPVTNRRPHTNVHTSLLPRVYIIVLPSVALTVENIDRKIAKSCEWSCFKTTSRSVFPREPIVYGQGRFQWGVVGNGGYGGIRRSTKGQLWTHVSSF